MDEMDNAPMIPTNSSRTSETETVSHGIGRVAHDIVTLAELQAQLFKNDLHEATHRFTRPCAIFTSGILLLLGTIPVALIAIALALIAAGLTPLAAYASVGLAGLIVAAALALRGWQRLCAMPPAFTRSREELAHNIVLIKDAVTHQGGKSQVFPDDMRNDRRN